MRVLKLFFSGASTSSPLRGSLNFCEGNQMKNHLFFKQGALRLAVVTAFGVTTAMMSLNSAAVGTNNASLAVGATVNDQCNITTTPIAFGVIDVLAGGATTGTGSFTATCTNGTAYSVVMGRGLNNLGASDTGRRMISGSDYIAYGLFTELAHTNNWASTGSSGAGVAVGTGTGSVDTPVNIYGLIPPSNSMKQGTYSDTISAIINF